MPDQTREKLIDTIVADLERAWREPIGRRLRTIDSLRDILRRRLPPPAAAQPSELEADVDRWIGASLPATFAQFREETQQEVRTFALWLYARKAAQEIDRLRAALEQIAEHPHCDYDHPSNGGGPYGTGIADGHRCAANFARRALTKEDRNGR